MATGIVTSMLKNDPYAFDAGEEYHAIATLDVQSLNNDELGMAVMVPKDEMTAVDRTTDINFFELGYETVPAKNFSHVVSETYYVAQKIENNVPARHYFLLCGDSKIRSGRKSTISKLTSTKKRRS